MELVSSSGSRVGDAFFTACAQAEAGLVSWVRRVHRRRVRGGCRLVGDDALSETEETCVTHVVTEVSC